MTNITYINTAFDVHYCFFQYGLRGINQALMTMYIISQNKRTAIVGPKTIQLCRYIDIDKISFLKYFVCGRNTMGKFLIHTYAGITGEFIGKRRSRSGAEPFQHFAAKL